MAGGTKPTTQTPNKIYNLKEIESQIKFLKKLEPFLPLITSGEIIDFGEEEEIKRLEYIDRSRITLEGDEYPSGLVLYTVNYEKIERGFKEKIREWENKRIVFVDEKTGELLVVPLQTRYTEEGRRVYKRKIRNKFKNVIKWGVFLTLTFDTKKIQKFMAWKYLGKLVSGFIDKLNKNRQYKFKSTKRLKYFWVVEVMKDGKARGYPHIHIFFPGLNWLWDKEKIEKIWGWGSTRVEKSRTVNLKNYLLKYVTKMSGWVPEGLIFLWYYKRRLYSCSRGVLLKEGYLDGQNRVWVFYGIYYPNVDCVVVCRKESKNGFG